MRDAEGKRRVSYVGMPWMPRLNLFALVVMEGFDGAHPYLVGSALDRADFRDVDLRVLLEDAKFDVLFGPEVDWRANPALEAHNMAWAALAKDLTGLPVDFQIEQQTAANAEHGGKVRHPLGVGRPTQ
jgi:hypothetical protein